jgi:hypothetical protein
MTNVTADGERKVATDSTCCKTKYIIVAISTGECTILTADEPGAEARGLVAPSIARPVLTASRPCQTMATTGPEAMYLIRPGKKGFSFRSS